MKAKTQTVLILSLSFLLACEKSSIIYQSEKYCIYNNHVTEGDFTAKAISANEITSNYEGKQATWKLASSLSAYPQYKSGQLLVDALYNLSLEEMVKDIRPDSTFMAGEKWDGVWTRDISYSIALSLAILKPEIAKNSLLRKVKNKRIIQDTGTGGSWPISTDRVTWALAAWEVYCVTGNKQWLAEAFEIINNSASDDLHVAFDPETNLMRGESSFLDWREQSYPAWMGPVDIYGSENLGTNAVHYQNYQILAQMAGELGLPKSAYIEMALKIKEGINKHLWIDSLGHYGQYITANGPKSISNRSEALGGALCVLFDIAAPQQQKQLIANAPTTAYGIPCISPQIPGIAPYHNNAIWPFVQSFWALAAARAGNTRAVEHSLASIYRASALFLTNKENMVAESGNCIGTAINSDRQLWSVAGNLAMVYKLFFGMRFQPGGIEFKPFVPKTYCGNKCISNLTFRQMSLNIELKGYGNKIKSFKIDGQESAQHFIGANHKGNHQIKIEMGSGTGTDQKINLQPIRFEAFPTNNADTAMNYINFEVVNPCPTSNKNHKANSKGAYIELSKQNNTLFPFILDAPTDGAYLISFRYANGMGPINTSNKCCIRTLNQGGKHIGAIVFPQRGENEWANWGYSNSLPVKLMKGKNKLSLSFEPFNENMNVEVNTARIDLIRIVKVHD